MITAKCRASLRMNILAKVFEIEHFIAFICYDNQRARSVSYVCSALDITHTWLIIIITTTTIMIAAKTYWVLACAGVLGTWCWISPLDIRQSLDTHPVIIPLFQAWQNCHSWSHTNHTFYTRTWVQTSYLLYSLPGGEISEWWSEAGNGTGCL